MDIVAENSARQILRQIYSGGFQLRPLPSENSSVFLVEFPDDRETVVLKLPKHKTDELEREQRILDTLESLGIPVPQVLYTQENQQVGNAFYTITRYIEGPSIGEIIANDDSQTEAIFSQIGRLAADLSAIPLEQIPDALEAEKVQRDELDWWEKHLDFLTRHRRTTRVLELLYHAARGILLVPPTVFGHRDGVQVVTDGRQVYVMDVGASGYNWPDADFARLLYAGIARYDGANHRIWHEAVRQSYLQSRELSDADVERIIILMIYYAVRDAAYLAAAGKGSHVEAQFDIADYCLSDVRQWFGR